MVVGGGIMQLADKPAVGQLPNQTKIYLYLFNTISLNHVLWLFSTLELPLSPQYLIDRICDRQVGLRVGFIKALNRSPFPHKQERKQILMLLSL